MTNKINLLSEEYFGEDKKKTYLKDDFTKALRGTIVRNVMAELLAELSENRTNRKSNPDGSLQIGDFDPDGAGFLLNIFNVYENGWMIDIRQLLTPSETGAGGKFINDITKLTSDDFINFYKNEGAAPRILLNDTLNDKSVKTRDDFIALVDSSQSKIDKATRGLVKKAQDFNNKNYFNNIVRDYQSIEFHKDHQPEKYNLSETETNLSSIKIKTTARDRKSEIKIDIIAECLNDFAEIVSTYQTLSGHNASFTGSSWPIEVLIDKTFELFTYTVSDDLKNKVADETLQYLHKSIDLVKWNHKKTLERAQE